MYRILLAIFFVLSICGVGFTQTLSQDQIDLQKAKNELLASQLYQLKLQSDLEKAKADYAKDLADRPVVIVEVPSAPIEPIEPDETLYK